MHAVVDSFLTRIRLARRPEIKRRRQRANIQEAFCSGRTRSPLKRKSSSKMNGKARASANGHPTMPAVAKNKVAARVLLLFAMEEGENANANARVTAYIAKDDGRNAVEDKGLHTLQ
jgi:hypothetical protein